jgi:hypothetical protein
VTRVLLRDVTNEVCICAHVHVRQDDGIALLCLNSLNLVGCADNLKNFFINRSESLELSTSGIMNTRNQNLSEAVPIPVNR